MLVVQNINCKYFLSYIFLRKSMKQEMLLMFTDLKDS